MTSSRTLGFVTPESDYDVIFVVTDQALAQYAQMHSSLQRGVTITPVGKADIWHDSPSNLQLGKVEPWKLPAFAEALVLYDRTGETRRLMDALRQMPEDQAKAEIEYWYDTYLNGLYRSLKAWRWGNELGGRMEAAQTADYLLYVLFALERRWRPYSNRLFFHLNKLEGQGWNSGELSTILLDLISTGNPSRQQAVARRVAALLQERGFGHVYDAWDGQIDQVLAWVFP